MPKADASQSPVKVGDVVAEKYRVEKVLGAGGMGVVVAARHVTLDQRFAIKFLLRDALISDELRQRFLREAKSAVRLKSEHVARVVDVATLATGEPYMVMEYLEGSDLADLVHENSITPVEAVTYIRQACDALAEAHSLGIVHRDLKPANLFLADLGRGKKSIKVLDFGISKSTDAASLSLTHTTAVMGSPLYMSPEQMKATRNVDARTDVWSLGVTLYEMLCGEVPFTAESPMALGAKVMHDEPKSPSDLRPELPRELSAIVLKCLEKNPANRFASVTELQQALEPLQSGALPISPARRMVVSVPASQPVSMGTTLSASGAVSVKTSHARTGWKNRRSAILAFGGAAIGVGGLVFFAHESQTSAPAIARAPIATSPTPPSPSATQIASANAAVETASTSAATTPTVATAPSASASASNKTFTHRRAATHADTTPDKPPASAVTPISTAAPPPTASAHAQAPDDPYGHM